MICPPPGPARNARPMPRLRLRPTMPLLRCCCWRAAISADRTPRRRLPPTARCRCSRTTSTFRSTRPGRWRRCACSGPTRCGLRSAGSHRPQADLAQAPQALQRRDPADYPAGSWAIYDAIVTQAKAQGITPNFDLLGGSPIWATGPGAPRDGRPHFNWSPNPKEFGQFARGRGDALQRQLQPLHQAGSTPATRPTSPESACGRCGTSPTTGRAWPPRASRAT